MGHLDLRISENKTPDDGQDAPVKDGGTSQPNAQSPKKEDEHDGAGKKAPDVFTNNTSDDRPR